MKLYLLGFLILTACPKSSAENPPALSKYMTKSSVVERYLALRDNKSVEAAVALTAEEQLRKNSLVPLKEMFSEKEMRVFQFNLESTGNDVDLRGQSTPVKNQKNKPWCTAFAGVSAIESTLNKENWIPNLDISEEHAWSTYQQYSSVAFVKAALANKFCDDKYWPFLGKQDDKCATTAHYKLANTRAIPISDIQGALDRGNVVYFATQVPSDMLKCGAVINPNTTMEQSGHALVIEGIYNDSRLEAPIVLLKNSWGEYCGDKGYQALGLAHCKNSYCQAWEFIKAEK